VWKRGPKCLEVRPSEHYIGPKMTFSHFSNFCRKKFPGLTKEISCTYWFFHLIFGNFNPQSNKEEGQEFFFCRNLKNERMSFLGLTSRHLGPLLLKSRGA
jgi:hypothetical protein